MPSGNLCVRGLGTPLIPGQNNSCILESDTGPAGRAGGLTNDAHTATMDGPPATRRGLHPEYHSVQFL